LKPIVFDGCVGWLHEGQSGQGVVICESLGHEAFWTHKLTRALAEHLARAGVWVLRFNYPCAGDSAGDDIESGRFARSVASIHRAADVLRAHANISDLIFLGIRAGALFAMKAAAEAGVIAGPRVDALVALAPVVRGRAYMRELSLIHRQWLDTAPPDIQREQHSEPCVNILGHRYPADLVSEMRATDACEIARHADSLPASVLLVDIDQGDGSLLGSVLQSRAVDVTIDAFDEWPAAIVESTRSRLPIDAIESLTRWIVGRRQTATASVRSDSHASAARSAESTHSVEMDGMTETVVRVGPDRLVGILCSPSEINPARHGAPALLIANTAANHRGADGRVGVRMARALARHGITTLRIDVTGVGDSGPHAPDDQSGVPYSDQAIEDVAAAAAWLVEQGHQEVVAAGICSGAYASLHAAARTTCVAGVIAINLPRFVWPAGQTLEAVMQQRINSARGYCVSMRNWRKWKRLVSERRDLRPILRALCRPVVSRFRLPVIRAAERLGRTPRDGTERGLLHALERRRVRTLLVYGEFDHGIDELHRHFGSAAHAFKGSRHVRVHTIRHLDHSLYGTAGADAVIDLCIQTLTGGAVRPAASGPVSSAAGTESQPLAAVSVRGS
jgi:alpha/beta superfamily hydrolase